MSDLIDRVAKDINVPCTDTISRQAAVDGTKKIPDLSVYAYCSFLNMLSKLPSVQEWIPVTERLPEECKSVLICINDGNKYCIDVSYRTDYNLWERYGRVNVTAWMPLPDPYKGEE